jgi:hypothetical protein
VFFAVFLMVILGEKFAKPMSDKQQKTYAKIIPILVFVLLISAILKAII